MASQNNIPFASQNVSEITSLIKALDAGAKKGKVRDNKKTRDFSCKKATFEVAGTDRVIVDSWRFQDWDYKRDDLPTYARGLFSYKRRDGTPEIVIRGYDKFFNVGEVNDTQWRNVENGTKGPYELSVKENGCIIFISGLEDDVLLVCSKHSTGPRGDADISHAIAGEKWVDKQLAAIGKTRHELARDLRNRNATAVAELCDDTFEEHVLAYDERTAGLYLHGINLNLPVFTTYPGHMIHKFADEWGFKKAEYLIKDDIETVKTFLEGCAETGSWNGRDTEGFVIRCQKRRRGSEPYIDWFFKFKFEEPYLMYRQWREVTKAVISGKVPTFKKHKKITEEYLLYAKRRLAKSPGLGKAFNANHGIIEMRNGFLQERGLKGSDIARQQENAEDDKSGSVATNVILVPIATIGCGKTTVALALTKLFGWGQVQNDNITGKTGRPKQFVTQICNSLAEWPVVIADRNNHQKRERKQLLEDVEKIVPDAHFVALHYVHDLSPNIIPEIREVTRQRVLERGDNHQTIQAGTGSQGAIIEIMEGFLKRFEPIDTGVEPDARFDEVIDLDVLADSRHNLETIINALHSTYPKIVPAIPSSSDLDDAIAAAMHDYQPDIKHDLSFNSKNKNKPRNSKIQSHHEPAQIKPPKLEYFCLRIPPGQIVSSLESTFRSLEPEAAKFYRQLQQSRRVQPAFHATLVHRASATQRPELWDSLSNLYLTKQKENPGLPPSLGKCRVQLERVVWDNRVMCVVARLLDEGWETANAVPHVTVGTANTSIKPKESNTLLEKWLQTGSGGETGISEAEWKGDKEVLCEARAVMQGGNP
ncbi:hypothetical protein MMC06_003739 [Schaereria dolodes]|nr:hypothetical protein [Schaereria dolodes]